jgi:hypothetical protein
MISVGGFERNSALADFICSGVISRQIVQIVIVHGITTHEQILNPGAVQARQKLAEFGR